MAGVARWRTRRFRASRRPRWLPPGVLRRLSAAQRLPRSDSAQRDYFGAHTSADRPAARGVLPQQLDRARRSHELAIVQRVAREGSGAALAPESRGGTDVKDRRTVAATTIVMAALAGLLAAQAPKTGSPEEHLPPNITQLTAFGERASWSPDGKRIAFMAKSFGDAFVVDVAHKDDPAADALPERRLPARAVPAERRLLPDRRAHLHRHPDDARSRPGDVGARRGRQGQPVALDHKISEGVAISRKTHEDRLVEHARPVSRPARRGRIGDLHGRHRRRGRPAEARQQEGDDPRAKRPSARSRRRTSARTTPS